MRLEMTCALHPLSKFRITYTSDVGKSPDEVVVEAKNADHADDLFWDEVRRLNLVGVIHNVEIEAVA